MSILKFVQIICFLSIKINISFCQSPYEISYGDTMYMKDTFDITRNFVIKPENREGSWKVNYSNGPLLYIIYTYKSREIESIKEYFDSGDSSITLFGSGRVIEQTRFTLGKVLGKTSWRYSDDLKNVLSKNMQYFPSGSLFYISYYINNIPVYIYKEWYSNGNLKKLAYYSTDTNNIPNEAHSNIIYADECFYKNYVVPKLSDPSFIDTIFFNYSYNWFENGKIRTTYLVRRKRKKMVELMYFDNGQIQSKRRFKLGNLEISNLNDYGRACPEIWFLDGKCIFWNSYGQLTEKTQYLRGELVPNR